MLFRQKINISAIILPMHFDKGLLLQTFFRALVVSGVLALGAAAAVFGQETLQTQPSPSPAARPPADQTPGANQVPAAAIPPKPVAIYNLLQKKSVVFPDIAYSTQRLSPGQKFELFVDNSVSVDAIFWSALGSAVTQADDSPTGFPQGWGGYGRRFGADLARESSSEFFGTFALASALHEDPRFYAEINPPFFHAMKYSAQRVFVSQNDDGRTVVSWSKLGGPLLSEVLANVYYPNRNRTVGDTLFRFGLDLASSASGNMLREYWPVFLAKISHRQPVQ
jgi:hypothetical protein